MVVNFEMCHLRSLGRVANFKNEAFRNGGIGFVFFGVFNLSHMLSYDHQGGLGGVITSLTSTSLTLRNMHTLHMLLYDHQGGRGDVLTSLRSTSVTLRNTHTLRMLSYDHQGGGGWGCINVFDEHFPYVTEQVYPKKYTWAYSWTWRDNVALQSVASALPRGALALKRREEEKTG